MKSKWWSNFVAEQSSQMQLAPRTPQESPHGLVPERGGRAFLKLSLSLGQRLGSPFPSGNLVVPSSLPQLNRPRSAGLPTALGFLSILAKRRLHVAVSRNGLGCNDATPSHGQ
jgi:hypothetical protein